ACASRTIVAASCPFKPYAPILTKCVQSRCASSSGILAAGHSANSSNANATRARFRTREDATSKLKPDTYLHPAGCVPRRGGTDEPELRVTGIVSAVRGREARSIREVVEFRPHLDFHAFLGHEFFIEVRVEVVDAIRAESGKITRGIARNLVTGISET